MNVQTLLSRALPAALLLAAPALLAAPSTTVAPAPVAECRLLDAVDALSALEGGPNLAVTVDIDGVHISERLTGHVVLDVRRDGTAIVGPEGTQRPAAGRQATTRVVRSTSADQTRIFSESITSVGARVLVVEAGEVNDTGLHVIAFDNDDLHVTDGEGELIWSSRTLPDGELVEREGWLYGAGCVRRTLPDGRQFTASL